MIEVEWAHLKAHELRSLATNDAVVIVPVASMEQHGPHLPVHVDTLLCTTVAQRAARRVAERQPIVVTPSVWFGLSEHHLSFGGTLTLDFFVFHGVIRCICRSLVRQGFRRILLLNGHGGNRSGLNVVVDELTQELRVPIVTVTYWMIAKQAFAEILERQNTVRHACEAETSMVLALCPELVDLACLKNAKGPSSPELSEFVGDDVYRWRSFASRTTSGVIGEAEMATAEKGERLLKAAEEALARILTTAELWSLQT
jgi:creatinine amidohydrolase